MNKLLAKKKRKKNKLWSNLRDDAIGLEAEDRSPVADGDRRDDEEKIHLSKVENEREQARLADENSPRILKVAKVLAVVHVEHIVQVVR